MSTDRIIIHADIADPFLEALEVTLSGFVESSPSPLHVVSSASKSRIQKLVSAALADGASSLLGPMEQVQPMGTDGNTPVTVHPMIIGDIKETMDLWQQEIFGPVAAYIIAKSDEEAVDIVNKTEYGISAAVFTRDLRKAFAIAKQLESG